jgi:hypothetical protein
MRIIGAVFLAFWVFALDHPAAAQAKQDFTLANATGYVISHVYVSPSKEDAWGDDILGRDTLDEDTEVPIHFARKERTCHWDLRVTYEDDGSNVIWRDVDLCQISKITIKYNRKTDTTSAVSE